MRHSNYVAEQLEPRRLLAVITSGQRLTDTISVIGELDTDTFAANAHDSVSIVVGSLGGSGFFPRIQVIAPNGIAMNPVGTDFDFDRSNLALTGTYSIVVQDDNNAATGSYALTMIREPATQIVDADSGVIASNQRRTGTIDVGDQDVYTFDANAGESVSAVIGSLGGSGFFPRIQLFAPNGAPLNDPGTDFAFDLSGLPSTGTYFVVVRDDNNASPGDYALTIIKTPGTQTVDADSGAIASNQRRTGTVESGDQDVYTFAANAGDSLSAIVGSLGGSGFFPRIQLFSPTGIPLDSPGTDFAFDTTNLAQTGTYFIVVRDDNNASPGDYALTIIKTPGTQTIDADSGTIGSNQRRTGTIESGDQDIYTIDANAGESLSAVIGSLGGSGFFPRIQIFAPNGVPMDTPGTDFAFDVSGLPLTGTYYVVVRDDNNASPGSYALTVIKTPGTQTLDADSGTIASNQRRGGTIDVGDQDIYTFSANAGESVSAVVGFLSGSGFFPRIQIFAPNGAPLNSPGTDYALDFSSLPQTGTYFLVVRDDNNASGGDYAVTVIKTPGAQTIDADSGAIASNEHREGMIDSGDQDVYTFTANAGDSALALVGSLGGSGFFPRIQVFAPNGVPLNAAGVATEFDAQNLPLTGTYFVVVRDDNNGSPGRYSLSLAHLPGTQVPDTLDNDGGAIASTQTRTGAITAGDLDVYTINLTAGNSMTVRMGFLSGTGFFPRIDLYAPNGTLVGTQIASPVTLTLNPAPLDGTYYIIARDSNNSGVGNYAISVDAALDLDTRPPTVIESHFDYNVPRQQIVFRMNENVAATVAAGDLTLQNTTQNFTVPAANILPSFNTASNEIVFNFQNYPFLALPDGDYHATLNAGSVADTAGNPLGQAVSFDFFFLNGDANHDRRVNVLDFGTLATNFGRFARSFSQADFNYDDNVNVSDFGILATQFGKVLAGDGSIQQTGERLGAIRSPFGQARIVDAVWKDDSLAALLA